MLKKVLPIILICVIALVIGYQNIIPHTFLSGWDNLHPEFDMTVNIRRAFFGVWQEYQGLGVLAGNAHPTELLRLLLLWPFTTFLPLWSIRYVYHLVFWTIGGIGAYYFGKKILHEDDKPFAFGAFVAAVFYLLNLGTLQNFYAPYEAFTHHFALLPWVLLALLQYLEKPSRKRLGILALVHLAASPSYYIPTIFIVFFIIHSLIILFFTCMHYATHKLQTATIATIILLIVNAYWLLPFGYFVSQGTDFVSQSTINSLFTDEAFLRNQLYGSLHNVIIMKGFWFSNTDMANTAGTQFMMMDAWIGFTEQLPVQLLLYGFFLLLCLGMYSLFANKNRYRFTLLALIGLCFFALLNDNAPTGVIFRFLQDHMPLFKQVFRLPFTKFIVATSLFYSMLIGAGAGYLISMIHKQLYQSLLTALIVVLVFYTSFPSFNGNFFYHKMRVTVPTDYFEVFSYFQKQPEYGKIAYLPQPTFWGWVTYDWGYRGSGFPWYGIPQPILDRAFDVWSLTNEEYYHELSYALYEVDDPNQMQRVLDKYNVEYVWIDAAIISPHKPQLSNSEALQKKIEGLPTFDLAFKTQRTMVYKRKETLPVLTSGQLTRVAKDTRFSMLDSEYTTYGPYLTQLSDPQVQLPFSDLLSVNHTWQVTEKNNVRELRASIGDTRQELVSQGREQQQLAAIYYIDADNSLHIKQQRPDLKSHVFSTPPTEISSRYLTPQPIEFFSHGTLLYEPSTTEHPITLTSGQDISVYTVDALHSHTLSPTIFTAHPTNCDSQKRDSYSVKLNATNQLVLSGTADTKPCVYEQFSKLAPQSSSLNSFIYDVLVTLKPSPQARLAVCFTRNDQETCVLNNQTSTAVSANEWVTYKYTVPSTDYTPDTAWIKLQLSPQSKEPSQVVIRDVVVRTASASGFIMPTQSLFSSKAEKLVATNAAERFVSIQLKEEDVLTLSPYNLEHVAQNCYPLGKGSYSRIPKREGETEFVRYSAHNASSCETIALGTGFDAGALISLRTRTLSGRPAKICLRHDPPGHCIREFTLPQQQSSTWGDYSFVIPPLEEKGSLFLEIDTFSLGSEVRTTDVASIRIEPLPVASLQQLVTVPIGTTLHTPPQPLLPAERATRYEYYFYKTVVSGPTHLVLPQTYRSGWFAFSLTQPLTAFEHVKVNGWANGWYIPQGTYTVYILFWPQLLSFVGYGCGIACIILIVRKKS